MRLRVLEYWSDGVDERRSDGVYGHGHWRNGVLEGWRDDIHTGPCNDLTIAILHYSTTPILHLISPGRLTFAIRRSDVRPARAKASDRGRAAFR
jgi:hypothetical protein